MPKNKNFEEQLIELETIIKNLEGGQLSLDKSLEEYKNGITIIKNCSDIIKKVEEEVEKLTEDLNND